MHGEELLFHNYLSASLTAEDTQTLLGESGDANSLAASVSYMQPDSTQPFLSGRTMMQKLDLAKSQRSAAMLSSNADELQDVTSRFNVKLPKTMPAGARAEYISAFGSQTKLPRTPLLPI